jgi:hypothetical protein
MTDNRSLSGVLGVWFIFASIVPLVGSIGSFFSIISSFLLGFGFPMNPSFYQIFFLFSPFIIVVLGWGLTDGANWARYGSILFTILSIILGVASGLLVQVGQNPAWITMDIIILGVLLCDVNRTEIVTKPSDELSNHTPQKLE